MLLQMIEMLKLEKAQFIHSDSVLYPKLIQEHIFELATTFLIFTPHLGNILALRYQHPAYLSFTSKSNWSMYPAEHLPDKVQQNGFSVFEDYKIQIDRLVLKTMNFHQIDFFLLFYLTPYLKQRFFK